MNRPRLAATFRIVAAVLCLSVVLATIALWLTSVCAHRPIQLYGGNLVGTTRLSYYCRGDTLSCSYDIGWKNMAPASGVVCQFPGLFVGRNVVTLTGETQGDVLYHIGVRWWLIAAAELPILVLATFFIRPLLRRLPKPGHCPTCHYDLRATPNRDGTLLNYCPECGWNAPTPSAL